jgi:hypothetical protein
MPTSTQKEWDDRHFNEAVMQSLTVIADVINKFGAFRLLLISCSPFACWIFSWRGKKWLQLPKQKTIHMLNRPKIPELVSTHDKDMTQLCIVPEIHLVVWWIKCMDVFTKKNIDSCLDTHAFLMCCMLLIADCSARQRLGLISSKLTKLEQTMTVVECRLASASGLPWFMSVGELRLVVAAAEDDDAASRVALNCHKTHQASVPRAEYVSTLVGYFFDRGKFVVIKTKVASVHAWLLTVSWNVPCFTPAWWCCLFVAWRGL